MYKFATLVSLRVPSGRQTDRQTEQASFILLLISHSQFYSASAPMDFVVSDVTEHTALLTWSETIHTYVPSPPPPSPTGLRGHLPEQQQKNIYDISVFIVVE